MNLSREFLFYLNSMLQDPSIPPTCTLWGVSHLNHWFPIMHSMASFHLLPRPILTNVILYVCVFAHTHTHVYIERERGETKKERE